MKLKPILLLLSAACALGALAFVSCAPTTSGTGSFIQSSDATNSTVNYSVDLGTSGKSVYLMVTNGNESQTATSENGPSKDLPSDFLVNKKIAFPDRIGSASADLELKKSLLSTSRRAAFSAQHPRRSDTTSSSTVTNPDAEGNTYTFHGNGQATHLVNSYYYDYNDVEVPATCRYASAPVTFPDGYTRTLSIWVADDCWGSSSLKRHYITADMVSACAKRFFGTALDGSDSIYYYVTNAIGSEWGSATDSSLIAETNNVTILLQDISNDGNSTDSSPADDGGTVGYFWSLNNLSSDYLTSYNSSHNSSYKSNERLMFNLDAVMYANPSSDGSTTASNDGWTSSCYWAEECYSTLAHEFQHMIHFYQKDVVRANGGSDSSWTDEMCSMLIEDLLSDKLGVMGPRGVEPTDTSAGSSGNTEGRMPCYNACDDVGIPLANACFSSSDLSTALTGYSVAYSFGAFLARNYGGAAFVKNVVQTSKLDDAAVVAACNAYSGKDEDFTTLLKHWALAVGLSSNSSAPAYYAYNNGGAFSSTVGSVTYTLGSINLFNYTYTYDGAACSGPRMASASSSTIKASTVNYSDNVYNGYSNRYYLLGSSLTGSQSWDITLPAGYTFSVIAQ